MSFPGIRLWFYGTLSLRSAVRHQTRLSPDVNQAPFLG